jgi:hypothetical protein
MRRALPRIPRTLCVAAAPAPRLLARTRTASSPFRTYATERLSLPERLRRKLWGTDAPPGSADPYTKKPAVAEEVSYDGIDRSSYIEATDARGLPIVGLDQQSGVWEFERYPSHPFLWIAIRC